LRETRDQSIDLMQGGGFQLRKWAANSPKLLEDIPNSSQSELNGSSSCETLEILGLSSSPREDTFCFMIMKLRQSRLLLRDAQSCRLSLNSTIHWDGLHLSLLPQRFCFKNSGCSRTIGMPQYRKTRYNDS
jgi:hypothetical protein